MGLRTMTPADYAAAKLDYARYQDGDELEFEQEMDAFLPAKLLLCRVDEAFQAFRAELDALGATLPLHEPSNEDLAELMTTATTSLAASHQAFMGRYVQGRAG